MTLVPAAIIDRGHVVDLGIYETRSLQQPACAACGALDCDHSDLVFAGISPAHPHHKVSEETEG